ncbi:MAG: aldehyde dehydrogenase family protein [Chloroflexi bacterium]|nr:aldehyde dehydrogenase family protein [Chloroflexota bacterium]
MMPSKIIFANGELISHNPTNGQEVGRVKVTDVEDVPLMVERARAAQGEWATRAVSERARRLRPLADHLYDLMEPVADTISRECGKPKVEALSSEIFPTMMHINYLADKAARTLRDEPLPDYWMTWLMGKRGRIVHRPYGVVGVIAPWNYPFWLMAGPALSALVAGNAVIAKPSEFTPLSGDWLRQLVAKLTLPEGLFQMAHGDGRVGAAIVKAGVDKMVFTGSTATGRRVMADAAQSLTPVTLELGGKDAAIVLEDADLRHAATGIVWGGLTCAGQVCASVERVYVAESVMEPFSRLVVEQVKALRVGEDLERSEIGSMNNERQMAIVQRQVAEAIAHGAKVLAGGAAGPGWFFPPTVLSDVPPDVELMRAETFGPVLPIQPVKDAAEAIRLANDSVWGLTASLWTKDVGRARQLAMQLNTGVVSINDHVSAAGCPDIPWGGTKETGFGRLQGREGLMTFVTPQAITHEALPLKRPWWYGYDRDSYRLFAGLMALLTTKSLGHKLRAVAGVLRHFDLRRLL